MRIFNFEKPKACEPMGCIPLLVYLLIIFGAVFGLIALFAILKPGKLIFGANATTSGVFLLLDTYI